MMWNEIQLIQQLHITQTYNKMLFYLQKFPMFGKKIPNRFYNAKIFKNVITVIGAIGAILNQFFTKALYFGILLLASLILVEVNPDSHQEISIVFKNFLFFLSIISGSISKIKQIDPSDLFDILCIRYLQMEPKRYYQAQMVLQYGFFFITYSLILGIVFAIIGESIIQALFFTILLIGLRFVSQVLYLFMFQPEKELPIRNYTILSLASVAIGCFLAPMYGYDYISPALPNLFGLGAAVTGLVLIGITMPILKNTTKYRKIVRTILTTEKIKETESLMSEAESITVQVDDDVLDEDSSFTTETETTGISYINNIFFERLDHLFKKRIRIAVAVLAFLFIVVSAVLFGVQQFGVIEITSADTESLFSGAWHIVIIYVSSLAYLGEHFTKFCFYNMDRVLMKNNYYRQPEYLLESIWIRLKYAIRFNLPIFITVIVGTTLVYFISGGRSILVLLLAYLSSAVLMVFFSVHYLFLYYLIQPYTENMENKSPIYSIASFITFYAPLVLLQEVEVMSSIVIVYIYAFILIYLVIGLLAVTKIAPKRFKLR